MPKTSSPRMNSPLRTSSEDKFPKTNSPLRRTSTVWGCVLRMCFSVWRQPLLSVPLCMYILCMRGPSAIACLKFMNSATRLVKQEPLKAGDWTAKARQIYCEFRRCVVPTHVSLILTARAPAKVSFGVLNVDFVCAGPDTAFQICFLARAGSCKPKFHRRIPRWDSDWTAMGRRLDEFHQ